MNFTRTNIIIASVAIVLLALLAWVFYRKGKKQVTLQYLPGELPGNPSSGNTIGASNDELKGIANAMQADMKGVNVTHNLSPYERALNLNDNDLIKLYNTFNKLYQGESGQTLYQWIDSEFWIGESYTLAKTLAARMTKLNLK